MVSLRASYLSESDGVEASVVNWNSDGAPDGCAVKLTLAPTSAIESGTPRNLRALLDDPDVNRGG